MARRPQAQPITRQIYFYQMEDIYDLWTSPTKPKFDPALLAKDLGALKGNDRYVPVNNEYDLCLICDSPNSFQFGKARKTDMARIEVNGQVKPLTLGRGEKLFDCIHIVFFPSGVVGAEFNLDAPKMPALTDYLMSKLTSCTPVLFDRLVNNDVLQRLDHLKEIKLIEMRVDTARSEVLAPFGDGWIATSRWMHDQLGAGSVEFFLRAGTTAHRPLLHKAIDSVREAFSAPKLRDSTDKFRIKAVPDGSDLTISIDLLEDKLMASVNIPRTIYQDPDLYREYIYDRIRQYYVALEPDIMQAVKVKVAV